MLVTANQVADTLRLVVPGFVMMKTFYVFGLQTKRSDAQWVVWSLLAAAPVVAIAGFFHPAPDALNFVLSLLLAILGGVALSWIWKLLARIWPKVAPGASIRAWDVVFSRRAAPRLQLELHDNRVLSGWADYPARSVETDDLDLYLRDPQLIVGNSYQPMPGLEGILIPRSSIASVYVVKR